MKLRAVFLLVVVTLFILGALSSGAPPASIVQAQQQCGVDFDFQDQNGLVVIEIESAAAVGDWASETALPDFTGSAYYRWDGGNNFGTPNIDTLEYQVRINTPGKYRFIWRTRITEGDNPTEGNDAWLKLPDASAFYGEKGDGSVVYPRDNGQGPGGADLTPYPEGASSDGWLKVYSSGDVALRDWVWQGRTSDNDAHDVIAEFDSPGTYTIQVSGRSQGFAIDRMVLYKLDTYSEGSATGETIPETGCDDNPLQVVNTDPEDGETDVNARNITISFSEPATVSGDWFNIACPPSDILITPGNGATVTQDLTSYVIDPDPNLPSGYTCEITVVGSQVVDSNNTPLPQDYTFSYTRSGNAAPVVIDTTPANGATDVSVSTNIELTFSEDVTIDMSRSRWLDIDCESVTDIRGDAVTVTGDGATRTIDPDADLPLGEVCTVTINRADVQDTEGARLLDSYAFSFTTGTPLVPGVTVTESGGATAVTEGGNTDTYQVVLDSPPTGDVLISIDSGDNQLTTSPDNLTFTSANWDTPQTVTVTAVDDSLFEESHSSSLSHTVSSSDSDYDGISVADIPVSITDNDNPPPGTPAVLITQSDGTTIVSEDVLTDTYQVVLNSQPTDEVTVSLATNSQLETSVTSVTFLTSNWDISQTVTVRAVDDDISEGRHTSSISHTVTSNDTDYNGIDTAPVLVTISDNDAFELFLPLVIR